jgi:hypothetical protein
MQQIADWLEKLNLGQYAQRFAENDIDVPVLGHLTDADLEKIGVSLGHRRKILAAIAELPCASPSKHEPADRVGLKPQETAERAKLEPNPALQRDFIDMKARKLARSYQFAERLQTFTSHNEGQRTLLSERLERLRRYLANKSAPL